jgi:hypothetical protein
MSGANGSGPPPRTTGPLPLVPLSIHNAPAAGAREARLAWKLADLRREQRCFKDAIDEVDRLRRKLAGVRVDAHDEVQAKATSEDLLKELKQAKENAESLAELADEKETVYLNEEDGVTDDGGRRRLGWAGRVAEDVLYRRGPAYTSSKNFWTTVHRNHPKPDWDSQPIPPTRQRAQFFHNALRGADLP